MTGMLASVADLGEAELAAELGADIVDLKDPSTGALGAWQAGAIESAVARLGDRVTLSATVGDIPPDAAAIDAAVARIAATGVDIVKVGLLPGGDDAGCLRALSRHATAGVRLVLVWLADLSDSALNARDLADAGLFGVMLDTARKQHTGLRGCWRDAALALFVDDARAQGLVTGLAGSLTIEDVTPLLALEPDYLGFRGALCAGGQRVARLDHARFRGVRAVIPRQSPASSRPTAAAGAQSAARAATSGTA
jgi:uncharacterized protein (UPF0264 family)